MASAFVPLAFIGFPAVHCKTHAPVDSAVTREKQAALAAQVRSGDVEAEAELTRLYSPGLLLTLRARTGDADAARDLCQEVLLAVVCALRHGQLREATRVTEFVHGIARNMANSYLRSRRRHPMDHLPESVAAAMSTDPVEASERRQALLRALASMPPADRRILMLTLVEGLKSGEIAARLGLNCEVVRTRKSRALRRIKQ